MIYSRYLLYQLSQLLFVSFNPIRYILVGQLLTRSYIWITFFSFGLLGHFPFPVEFGRFWHVYFFVRLLQCSRCDLKRSPWTREDSLDSVLCCKWWWFSSVFWLFSPSSRCGPHLSTYWQSICRWRAASHIEQLPIIIIGVVYVLNALLFNEYLSDDLLSLFFGDVWIDFLLSVLLLIFLFWIWLVGLWHYNW